MKNHRYRLFVVSLVLALAPLSIYASDKIKPFVLGSSEAGDIAGSMARVRTALKKNGFVVAGEYTPYTGAHIIVVTNDTLKKAAASHKRAGYIAAQRVALTEREGKVQISYTYPVYMGAAYRIDSDLTGVSEQLKSALGFVRYFGPEKGMTAEAARKYHYMMGMEYFDDAIDLASYPSHEKAIDALEKNLAAATGGVTKVYRIDIPGTRQVLFGVGMKASEDGNKYMDDKYIMSEIDFKPVRSTAHLPYEILVRDRKIEALHVRFRIAINFPDLSMMGANSFMNIMSSPDAIKKALTKAAGGTYEEY